MTEENEIKSRRGATRYQKNPFVEAAALATSTRVRRVADRHGEKLMVVSVEDGEILAPAGFWHEQTVDKTQFVKLYINGVRAFKDLSGAGSRAFELLYMRIQNNIGKDRIVLSFNEIDQAETPISEATFYRGVKELVLKFFIAETMVPSQYFVNPDYIWNGDRLAFVRAYRLKERHERNEEFFARPLGPLQEVASYKPHAADMEALKPEAIYKAEKKAASRSNRKKNDSKKDD